jgi:hypothetical protein
MLLARYWADARYGAPSQFTLDQFKGDSALGYSSLRGEGIFKESNQGSSGILTGSPRSLLESLLTKVDAYAAVIVIVSALLCALGGVVLAVSRGEADAPLVCCLIAISGLLCRSALPLSRV